MVKELFEDKNPLIEIIQDSMANIIETEYGFAFNESLFIPKTSSVGNVPNSGIFNLNFTIEPFKALWAELKYYSSVQRIPKSSKYHFSRMKPILGFRDVFGEYEDYFNVFYSAMLLENKGVEISTLNSFCEKFLHFLLKMGAPTTLTEYLKSNLVSVYNTGLAFCVIDEKMSTKKVEEYLLDSYLPVFQNLCMLHGFIIDSRIPWTIVYRVNDNTPNLTNAYVNAYDKEVISLLQVIGSLWMRYANNQLSQVSQNTINLNDKFIDANKFLDLYVRIKAKEQDVTLRQEQIDWIKIYLQANTVHNGLASSIRKLSYMNKDDKTLPQDWRQVFSQNRNL